MRFRRRPAAVAPGGRPPAYGHVATPAAPLSPARPSGPVPRLVTAVSDHQVLDRFPGRVLAFDEFGPLGIRPTGGNCRAEHPQVPATYHRTHGVLRVLRVRGQPDRSPLRTAGAVSSPSLIRTTPTTPSRPGHCTLTCAGATNARHLDVLAAQRRECAHIRSERAIRWGRAATRPSSMKPGEPTRSEN